MTTHARLKYQITPSLISVCVMGGTSTSAGESEVVARIRSFAILTRRLFGTTVDRENDDRANHGYQPDK